jgi:hypothetical protein
MQLMTCWQVWLGLTTLDTDCDVNTRIKVEAIDVTREKFTIKASSWADSITRLLKVSWFATWSPTVSIGERLVIEKNRV